MSFSSVQQPSITFRRQSSQFVVNLYSFKDMFNFFCKLDILTLLGARPKTVLDTRQECGCNSHWEVLPFPGRGGEGAFQVVFQYFALLAILLSTCTLLGMCFFFFGQLDFTLLEARPKTVLGGRQECGA